MKSPLALATAITLSALLSSPIRATEPNDTFADRTVLAPGVLSVTDDLYPGEGSAPDTLLGAFGGLFGDLIAEDDDGSSLGDGRASALSGVPIDTSGSISFTVTGYEDFFYEGSHSESGDYEAFVEVFDFFGDSVSEFSVTGTLTPGSPDEYDFSDFNWFNGSYSVEIDNTVTPPMGGDVDFFTFTGLTPGDDFSAETFSAGSIDTMLFWLDDAGNELDFNDDIDSSTFLSQLEGTVPSSGQLTFAVTGFGDDFLEGSHTEQEAYDLQLSLDGASVPGDFDNDGDVDGFDLTNPNVGWHARYGNDLDGQDFLIWQQAFTSGTLAASTVPEPTGFGLALTAMAVSLLIPTTFAR